MKISKEDLTHAVSEGILTGTQAEALWETLSKRTEQRPQFDLAHLAFYFGAFIVMAAMGWCMTLAWDSLGGVGILFLALLYAVCFCLAGRTLWFKQNLRVPGGLLFTVAVWMMPLAIYGLEKLCGMWPQGDPGTFRDYHIWVRGSWFFMEVGTIVAGLIMLRFIRFPFLTFPIAFSLWYMSMDLAPLLSGKNEFGWDERLWVSVWFGLAMLIATYLIDRRTKEDYAFWGYLFGVLAFWSGLSLMESGKEWAKFTYCLINLGLMIVSVLFQRRVFIVFGALGVFGYLSYLSYDVFKDSMMFPFVLSILGIFIIFLGVKYQRHRLAIEMAITTRIPRGLHSLLPQNRHAS